MDGWRQLNRAWWDERVPLHLASDFYDVEGFEAGRPRLLPFEVEEIGPLDGARIVHLQCHIGLDALDLVRLHPTARVVGLDFSEPAVEAARTLAARHRLGDRATFEVVDIFEAVASVGAGTADVVYTGKGALNWLPDIEGWAGMVRDLLVPGGFLYLCEFHPVGTALGDERPEPVIDYFRSDPLELDEPGTYADPTAPTQHTRTIEWQHSLDRVLGALLGAGLHLQLFHEWPFSAVKQFPWLVPHPEDRRLWTWPGPDSLPLMYSLKAFRPPA